MEKLEFNVLLLGGMRLFYQFQRLKKQAEQRKACDYNTNNFSEGRTNRVHSGQCHHVLITLPKA